MTTDDFFSGDKTACLLFSDLDFLRYAQRKLPPEKVTAIETHTFLASGCQSCFYRLTYWDNLIKAGVVNAHDINAYEQLMRSSLWRDELNHTLNKIKKDLHKEILDGFLNSPMWQIQTEEMMTELHNVLSITVYNKLSVRFFDAIAKIQGVTEMMQSQLNNIHPNQCPKWNESTFIKFWFSQLSELEYKEFNMHIHECTVCREHFNLLVQTQIKLTRNITHQAITEFHQQLKTEIAQMLEQTKADLISSVVKAVLAELRHAVEDKDKLAPGSVSTPTDDQATAKIIPLRRRTRPQIYLKAAAMLLAALIPMAAVYFFMLKPEGNHSQGALILQKERNNNESPANIETLSTLVKSREFDKAEPLLKQAIDQARQANNHGVESELTYLQGRMMSARGNLDSAREILLESLRLAELANKPELKLPPLITIATIYHILDQNNDALITARQVVDIAESVNQPLQKLKGLQLMGISVFLTSRSLEAENILEESVKLAKEQNSSYYLSASLTYLGIIRNEQRRFRDAEAYFRKAIMIAKQEGNAQQRANGLAIINGYYGRSLATAGNGSKASEHYQQAILLAQEAKEQQSLFLSQLHSGLGDSLKLEGKQEQAEQAMAKAKKLERQATERCERGNTFLSVAVNRTPTICKK